MKQKMFFNVLETRTIFNTTWVEFELNLDLIELNSSTLNGISISWIWIQLYSIPIPLNWIQILIEDKWDANWWRMHSKLSCEYGVGEKTSKRYKFEKHLSMPLQLRMFLINSNLELF